MSKRGMFAGITALFLIFLILGIQCVQAESVNASPSSSGTLSFPKTTGEYSCLYKIGKSACQTTQSSSTTGTIGQGVPITTQSRVPLYLVIVRDPVIFYENAGLEAPVDAGIIQHPLRFCKNCTSEMEGFSECSGGECYAAFNNLRIKGIFTSALSCWINISDIDDVSGENPRILCKLPKPTVTLAEVSASQIKGPTGSVILDIPMTGYSIDLNKLESRISNIASGSLTGYASASPQISRISFQEIMKYSGDYSGYPFDMDNARKSGDIYHASLYDGIRISYNITNGVAYVTNYPSAGKTVPAFPVETTVIKRYFSAYITIRSNTVSIDRINERVGEITKEYNGMQKLDVPSLNIGAIIQEIAKVDDLRSMLSALPNYQGTKAYSDLGQLRMDFGELAKKAGILASPTIPQQSASVLSTPGLSSAVISQTTPTCDDYKSRWDRGMCKWGFKSTPGSVPGQYCFGKTCFGSCLELWASDIPSANKSQLCPEETVQFPERTPEEIKQEYVDDGFTPINVNVKAQKIAASETTGEISGNLTAILLLKVVDYEGLMELVVKHSGAYQLHLAESKLKKFESEKAAGAALGAGGAAGKSASMTPKNTEGSVNAPLPNPTVPGTNSSPSTPASVSLPAGKDPTGIVSAARSTLGPGVKAATTSASYSSNNPIDDSNAVSLGGLQGYGGEGKAETYTPNPPITPGGGFSMKVTPPENGSVSATSDELNTSVVENDDGSDTVNLAAPLNSTDGTKTALIDVSDQYGNLVDSFPVDINVRPAPSPGTIAFLVFILLSLLTIFGFLGKTYLGRKSSEKLEKDIEEQVSAASRLLNL